MGPNKPHRPSVLLPFALIVSGLLQTSLQLEYEITDVVDPLQPVWDRFDTLLHDINKIVEPLKDEMRRGFIRVENNLERKMRTMISVVNSRISSLGTAGPDQSSDLNHTLSSVLRGFYVSRMQVDQDEATAKIERHVNNKFSEMETTLKSHIDDQFTGGLGGLETLVVTPRPGQATPGTPPLVLRLDSLVRHIEANNGTLQEINMHVAKINEKLDDVDTCGTLVDKVSELMSDVSSGSSGSTSTLHRPSTSSSSTCLGLDEEYVRELRMAVDRLRETPAFIPRDCSDHHWQRPEAPSGVFTTYPTMDSKNPVSAYCDMGEPTDKSSGGWTVIMRRQNTSWGLLNFNRTWEVYRAGFGVPGEGEWFYGLGPLHAITYRQPYEVRVLMTDIEKGSFYADYTTFRLEDEAQDFSLVVDGFSGNISTDSLAAKHHGSPFSTYDRDNDLWEDGNCAVSNGGGWWFNRCYLTTFTAPFPTSADRSAKTIRWHNDKEWLVFDDVTVMIRPAGYTDRFKTKTVGQ